jgi:hypothetical protein
VPTGDGDEGHRGGVVANLLDEPGHLLRDLLKPKPNIFAKDLKQKPRWEKIIRLSSAKIACP